MSTTATSLEAQTIAATSLESEPMRNQVRDHELGSLQKRSDGHRLEEANSSTQQLANAEIPSIPKWSATILIGNVACVSLINSMLSGLLVVCLPTMARDLNLPDSLVLWPASVNALSCGCTLLLSGSVADIVGGRRMYLIGTFCLTLTTIACGVCRTGIELILFRAAQGIAISLCLPSSVILITKSIPTGTWRNTAFSCLGAGQPLGFSVGLVLGGIFVQSIGWRYGYYIGAILIFLIFVASIFGLPVDPASETQTFSTVLKRLKSEIDWIGCLLISTPLGLFSYVLSVISGGSAHFLEPASLALFSIATLLIPAFVFYIRRQERLGRKVIIPPSLWANRVFTSLCITVFVVWGTFNAIQYFLTLFYQSVQSLSAIQTSLRFLPMVFTGAAANFVTGWLVKRVRADVLVFGSGIITGVAPLLMAIINPEWSYWACAFIATACTPICADVLFTIANLVITTVFPPQTHGLAGGVFNTVSNIGSSVGLAITAVVASSVTLAEKTSSSKALMDGYRASYWLCFGANVFAIAVAAFGLRKIGKVGIKTD